MKKITVTSENQYKTYLQIISPIVNISAQEINLLCWFDSYSHFPISSSDIKERVANDMKISRKTLHIMLRNLVAKQVLIKVSRGVYDRSNYIKYSDQILFTIQWK